jgi:hypothetical protein
MGLIGWEDPDQLNRAWCLMEEDMRNPLELINKFYIGF